MMQGSSRAGLSALPGTSSKAVLRSVPPPALLTITHPAHAYPCSQTSTSFPSSSGSARSHVRCCGLAHACCSGSAHAPANALQGIANTSCSSSGGGATMGCRHAGGVPRSSMRRRGRERGSVRCAGLFDFLGGKGPGGDKDGDDRAGQEAELRAKANAEAAKRRQEEERAVLAALADLVEQTQGTDSKPRPTEVERSEMVNEEMVYFIFQMDLDVQLQRALNYEAYELAQGVRAKRQRVDEALAAMMQRKADNVGSEAASAAMDSGDIAAEGLSLRTQMQRAVEEERYSDAARLRDMLAELERRAKRAEALAAEFKPTAAAPQFRLGQRVKHRKHGYRGLVVGWDAQCCESDEWAEEVGVSALPRGVRQPFYQLLVDVRDWSFFDYSLPPIAYAAEDLLWAPEQGGPEGMEALLATPSARAPPPPPPAAAGTGAEGPAAAEARTATAGGPSAGASAAASSSSGGGGGGGGSSGSSSGEVEAAGPGIGEPMSWLERFGNEGFRHPYEYMLFLGQDARGDYLPCKQLRDRYNVQRRDVWAPGQDGKEEEDSDDNDDNSPGGGGDDDKPEFFPRI